LVFQKPFIILITCNGSTHVPTIRLHRVTFDLYR
jgi:hypothetical protein